VNSLVLSQESGARIRFFNSAYCAERHLTLRTNEDVYQVEFVDDVGRFDATLSFEITGTTSGKLWVSLSEASTLAGLERWLGPCQLDDLPEGLGAMVLDAYLAVALETLGAKGGESFAITEVQRGGPPADMEYRLPFVLANADEQRVLGALHFESRWASTIEKMLPLVPAMEANSFAHLRVLAPLELGRTSLTIAELEALEPYDVVLLESSDLLTSQRVRLRLPPTFEIQCLVADDRLQVESIQEQPPSSTVATSADDTLSQARIPFSVHGQCVGVSCDQLNSLSCGDILEPCSRDAQTVDIVLSGRVVGHGELVRKEDRLGVRLLSLSPRRDFVAVAEAE
jgi:type III secretion protein Q